MNSTQVKHYLILIILTNLLTSCASYEMLPYQFHRIGHKSKLFYEIDNRYIMEERRDERISINEKVFVQGIISLQVNNYERLPFQGVTLREFDANLKQALKNNLPNFQMKEELTWTDKYFPEIYALQSFDPKEVKHEDLLKIASIRNNELTLIPLISVYLNERIDREKITYKLNLALYVIDAYQIYHAKSVGLSKSFDSYRINKNYEFRFSSSDWDFLVLEALGDLVERQGTKEFW